VKESNSLTFRGPDISTPSPRKAPGFTARLTGMSLVELVRLQSAAQVSGVFRVVSGERTGELHFVRGLLFHAETREQLGDAAALSILAWPDGEFSNAEGPLAQSTTVSSPLETLLSRVARDLDLQPGTARLMAATGIRRRVEPRASLRPLEDEGSEGSARTSDQAPASARDLRAVATPGIAAAPAPRWAGKVAEGRSLASVLVAARGDVVEGHGTDVDGLAARVSYITRLTELIGQAMGSGETRSLRVRSADTELTVQRYPDGRLQGTLVACEGSISAENTTSADADPVSTRLPIASPATLNGTRLP
jgi:hypothetical protein